MSIKARKGARVSHFIEFTCSDTRREFVRDARDAKARFNSGLSCRIHNDTCRPKRLWKCLLVADAFERLHNGRGDCVLFKELVLENPV